MTNTGQSDWTETVESALRERGLRLTSQRLAIAEAFFGAEGHPNADELCAQVKTRHPAIGQATVYRTLRLFQEVGLASSSNFGSNSARFEANDGHHHDHLICTKCDTIVEFMNEQIELLQEQVADKHGFELTSHRMELYGTCPSCQEQ